jgi:4-hydroxybenzoate polyprenyltransferase
MAMNDLADLPHDRRAKRDRPLVAGRLSPRAALNLMVAALAVAFLVLLPFHVGGVLAGLLLLGAITAYNVVHKRLASASLLMGVCRGLVYLLPAAMTARWENAGVLLAAAALMTAYVQAVTMVARGEDADGGARGAIPWAAGAALLATAPGIWLGGATGTVLAVGTGLLALPLVLALASRKPAMRGVVMGLLALIAVIDAAFCVAVGAGAAAVACAGCHVATKLLHPRISGT